MPRTTTTILDVFKMIFKTLATLIQDILKTFRSTPSSNPPIFYILTTSAIGYREYMMTNWGTLLSNVLSTVKAATEFAGYHIHIHHFVMPSEPMSDEERYQLQTQECHACKNAGFSCKTFFYKRRFPINGNEFKKLNLYSSPRIGL